MADEITIRDGSPYVWNSASIVPSNDSMLPTSPPVNPVPVDPVVTNEANVYVYVENTGTTDFGDCTCATGNWVAPPAFGGFSSNQVVPATALGGGLTFSASAFGGSLTNGADTITMSFGSTLISATAHAWALNGDKTLFAYAATTTANPTTAASVDWWIWITKVDAGAFTGSPTLNRIATDTLDTAFVAALFGWAGTGVVIQGPSTLAGGLKVTLAALPMASISFPLPINMGTGLTGWIVVASPCGSAVAMAPQKSSATATPDPDFILALTATASSGAFKQNGVPVATGIAGLLHSDGPNPSFKTVNHHALGVQIDTGGGVASSMVTVDDPDCTFLGGGVTVRVTRVQSTSIPSSGMGLMDVGMASLGTVNSGAAAWVKVPVTTSWQNMGSSGHWCLLAEGYNKVTIQPWDEVSDYSVGSFLNRAQRNIQIS